MSTIKLAFRSVGTPTTAPAERTPVAKTLQGGVTVALAQLETLHASDLHVQWWELFGRSAPRRLGPELLKQAIAYRLQEIAYGGLTRTIELRLKAAVTYAGKPRDKTATRGPAIKSGTRFVREWKGKTHEVLASGDGDFTYCGKTYRSLSVIACEITGTHQSGPRFFGLNSKPKQTSFREVANAR